MAVVLDAATLGGNVSSFTHVVGSGQNRYLLVELGYNNGSTTHPATVKYAGVDLLFLARANIVAGTNLGADIWGLAAPASGSNTVAVTWSGVTPGIGCGASSFTGVDQTNPTDGAGVSNSAAATANPTSAAKTGALGDMLVDAVVCSAGAALVVAGGGAQDWNDGGGEGSQHKQADGTSQTTSWTVAACDWAVALVLLKQVSAKQPLAVEFPPRHFGPF